MATAHIADRFRIERREPADIYVVDRFVNDYDDRRVKLDGETYDAKEIIKFDWDQTHHSFDDTDGTWIVDEDSVAELEQRLTDAGFSFESTPREPDHSFFELHDAVNKGDEIRVHYEQKNGEGRNSKSGEVTAVDFNSGYEDRPRIAFRRDDGQYMYFQFDRQGQVALYTGMSHAPFVGHVTEVEIV